MDVIEEEHRLEKPALVMRFPGESRDPSLEPVVQLTQRSPRIGNTPEREIDRVVCVGDRDRNLERSPKCTKRMQFARGIPAKVSHRTVRLAKKTV